MANMENDPKAKEVLEQEISVDDLNAVSGGSDWEGGGCTGVYHRDIHKGGFPNCVTTVEDGSRCGSNDACVSNQVYYTNMENCFFSDCSVSWR